MVGLTGVEPVTLRLSSACSNQLSYTPRLRAVRYGPASPQNGASQRLQSDRRAIAQRAMTGAPASLREKAGGAEETRTPDL